MNTLDEALDQGANPWLSTGCRRVPRHRTLDEIDRDLAPPETNPYPGAEYLGAFM